MTNQDSMTMHESVMWMKKITRHIHIKCHKKQSDIPLEYSSEHKISIHKTCCSLRLCLVSILERKGKKMREGKSLSFIWYEFKLKKIYMKVLE